MQADARTQQRQQRVYLREARVLLGEDAHL
jgi:hypothetical protein